MELYIIRHAWAEQRNDGQWSNDDLRPLTAEGRARFAKMAKKLGRVGMMPEVIATSPLTRCFETARIAATGRPDVEIVELDELLPGGNLEELLRWTVGQARDHREIAWVGHAPDVGLMTSALIGGGDGRIRFAKGAVAAVRFDDLPSLGAGELQWFIAAKLLGC